jgi:uncharacterized membrane protein HdeD (DUF308 family)
MDQVDTRIVDVLSHRWLLLLLRGVCAIAFGLFTWMNPGLSLDILIVAFGLYAFLDGIAMIAVALEGRVQERSGLLLAAGLIGIAIGIAAMLGPAATAIGLLVYIAAWAIVRGLLELGVALRVRHELRGEWRLITAACASIAFGLVLLARPGEGILAGVWLIGAFAIAFGLLLVLLSLRVRHSHGFPGPLGSRWSQQL